MPTQKTYKVKVYCQNCKWEGTQDIPKGSSVAILDTRDCPICECTALKSLGISKIMPLADNQWGTI